MDNSWYNYSSLFYLLWTNVLLKITPNDKNLAQKMPEIIYGLKNTVNHVQLKEPFYLQTGKA